MFSRSLNERPELSSSLSSKIPKTIFLITLRAFSESSFPTLFNAASQESANIKMPDSLKDGFGPSYRKASSSTSGSISLALPNEALLGRVLLSADILEAMKGATYSLLPGIPTDDQIKDARKSIRELLVAVVLEQH